MFDTLTAPQITDLEEGAEYVQDLERVEASYSSLTLHRKCAQAWYYRYTLGLKMDEGMTAPPRDFGSWWGAVRAADALVRGRALDSLVTEPGTFKVFDKLPKLDDRTVVVSDVLDVAGDWWSKLTPLDRDVWTEYLGEPLPARLRNAYVSWVDEWADERKHEEPLGVEVRWERQLPAPKNDPEFDFMRSRGMPDTWLMGYIDELYFNTERGHVIVRENKSHKGLSEHTIGDDLLESQPQVYAWGIAPQLKTWGLPPVKGLAYDRIRSIASPTPKATTTGTLSKSPSLYDLRTYLEWIGTDTRPAFDELDPESVSAATPEEIAQLLELPAGPFWGKPLEFFVTGAKKGQPKFGVLEESEKEIARLSDPSHRAAFHKRTLRPLSTSIVRTHLRAAVDSATDIWRTQQRTSRTGEAPRSMAKMNCNFCDFATLCKTQMVGGVEGTYELADFGLRQRGGGATLEPFELPQA